MIYFNNSQKKQIIYSKLSGGLGNNMFIYAHLKILAKNSNYNFFYIPYNNIFNAYHLKEKINQFLAIFKNFSSLNSLSRSLIFSKQKTAKDISVYFKLNNNQNYYLLYIFYSFFTKNRLIYIKQNNQEENINLINNPNYKFINLQTIQSFYLINKYRDEVISYFKLQSYYQKYIDNIEKTFEVSSDKRCCVHVRRGDYLWQDKKYKYKNQGWSLPMEYYHEAFKKIPKDILFIFVTDDFNYVNENFSVIKNKIILKNNPDPVDMFIFTLCKYNIIANSSFSAWGAWLNNIKDKRIFAPKYNIGWHKKIWYPKYFENQDLSWEYLDLKII